MSERSKLLERVGIINMSEDAIRKLRGDDMGEGERPDIYELKIGTVNDFDSIETPLSQKLSFVLKDKYDELEKEYNELLKVCQELEHEKEFFKDKSHEALYKLEYVENKIDDYKTTINTLVSLMGK